MEEKLGAFLLGPLTALGSKWLLPPLQHKQGLIYPRPSGA